MSPRTLFRIFANAEMVTWAGLISAIISRAVGGPDFVSIAGGAHGFIFLAYCVSTVFVWINQRWRPAVGVLGVGLAVIPFATLPFDLTIERKGLLRGGWRLGAGGEEPRGFLEHVQAWILRRPWLSATILLGLVVAVFLTLLWIGPPIPQQHS